MLKRLAIATIGLLISWVGGVGVGEASCTGSTILLFAPVNTVGPTVSVTWAIAPACDVIETGLLLGSSPTALTPIGQAIYGYREGYQQEVTVGETGSYWVGSYVRDEQGNVIRSPAKLVIIMVPYGSFSGFYIPSGFPWPPTVIYWN